jgi:hypothetical protein
MNLYELQARFEQLENRACLGYRQELDRAARRFRTVQAALTVERKDHDDTRRLCDLFRKICTGLSKENEALKRALRDR